MNIKLGTALYAHKNERIPIFSDMKIGTAIPGGSSVHRKGASASVKISAALKALESLFENKLSVYEMTSDNGIYCEWQKGMSAICDGVCITIDEAKESSGYNYPDILIPLVCYELSRYGTNEELKEIFARICEQIETFGAPNLQSLYDFCDSFYYGCALPKDTVDVTYTLNNESVTAAFRSGAFVPHNLILTSADNYWKKSKLDTGVKKIKKEKKESKFLERCKKGEFNVPFEWDAAQRTFVQPKEFLDSFVSTKDFEDLVNIVYNRAGRIIQRLDSGMSPLDAIGQDYTNSFLIGKPGTGKTTFAYALSAVTGMPVYTSAATKNTDEDEFEGKTKIVEGNPMFVSTDFLNAFENGGIIILEEPNLADPAVLMGALGQAIEFPYIIKKNGYETIRRHPLCIILAAMNVGTVGTKQLSQPFSNRFPETYRLEDPKKDDFINIIMKRTGAVDSLAEWVYNGYNSVVEYLKNPKVNAEDIVMELSLRTCFGAVKLIHDGIEPRRALSRTLVGAVARVDLELSEDIEREVISSLINPVF